MAHSVSRGGRIPLDAVYRDGAGNLADPVNPRVSIVNPAGAVVVADVVPTRRSLGIYDYPDGGYLVASDAALGTWVARWVGTINGFGVGPIDDPFEVLAVATVGRYAATVDDVRALLPHRAITDAREPKPATVERYLDGIAARVAARLETSLAILRGIAPTNATAGARLTELEAGARFATALGGAAVTEDSGFPERANLEATDTSYGAVLWARFLEYLDELEAAAAAVLTDLGPDVVGVEGQRRPGHSFPESNLFSLTQRW